MSEPIWVDMKVKFPSSWYDGGEEHPWWFTALADAFINGDAVIEPTDDGNWVAEISGEGNYGSSDSWAEEPLEWLAANGVPQMIHDDAKYEFQAEDKFFDGHEWWEGTSAGEDFALTSQTWRFINQRVDDENPGLSRIVRGSRVYFEVARYFERMRWDVTTADLSHLPTEMPPEPVPGGLSARRDAHSAVQADRERRATTGGDRGDPSTHRRR
jgi:hypothetical protein